MTIEEAISLITPVPQEKKDKALAQFHQLAMPLDSLGTLQDLVVQLCGITSTSPHIEKRGVVVFCGDHGVVAQGVSQVDSHVTSAVAKSLCNHETVMCQMAKSAKCDVIPVDIGMKYAIDHPVIRLHSIASGTKDFSKEPAMTKEQARSSVEIGIALAQDLKKEGYQLLATGEMGIGNTTPSSAITSVLLDIPVKEVTGYGAGLTPEGLQRKIKIIEESIKKHRPDPENPLDILEKVGGFEIGGILGLMFGCAVLNMPCVVDGFISNVAALMGIRLCPSLLDYLLFSHGTQEQGGQAILQHLGQSPLLQGNFRLGEGSGAVALLPLLDMGLSVLQMGVTFEGMEIPPYRNLTLT